jgi:3-demethylubiquinone-9 3-methyltransferase
MRGSMAQIAARRTGRGTTQPGPRDGWRITPVSNNGAARSSSSGFVKGFDGIDLGGAPEGHCRGEQYDQECGGAESECGWCKDRWGLSWQITPRTLMDALSAGGAEAKRAFEAMMTMKKIDVAAIETARRG